MIDDFTVQIYPVEIRPHTNADALDIAIVGGMQAIVKKGQFFDGELALFFGQGSVLTDSLLKILNFWDEDKDKGKLAGSKGNRVKPMRLRGEMSNGVVASIDEAMVLLAGFESNYVWEVGVDYSKVLGVIKYVPEIPASMSGIVSPSPLEVKMFNIPRGQHPDQLDKFEDGELVYVTEKIHGTCFLYSVNYYTGEVIVSSKGQANKGLKIEESDSNVYWQMANRPQWNDLKLSIFRWLEDTGLALLHDDLWINIRSEIFGSGVQDLKYGLTNKKVAVFDIELRSSTWNHHVDFPVVYSIASGFGSGYSDIVMSVPYLGAHLFDRESLQNMASGNTTITEDDHIREGVVVTCAEGTGRVQKFINPEYEVRKGGTEYN